MMGNQSMTQNKREFNIFTNGDRWLAGSHKTACRLGEFSEVRSSVFPLWRFFVCLFVCLFFNAILGGTNDRPFFSGDPSYVSLYRQLRPETPNVSQVSLKTSDGHSKVGLIDWIQGQCPGAAFQGNCKLQANRGFPTCTRNKLKVSHR